jgi:hypothetical protein
MFWYYFFLIYGIFCVFIGLLKPPFIWNMKKFETMKKIFGGNLGLQIFVLVWGVASICLAIFVFK